jgi:metalloprotease
MLKFLPIVLMILYGLAMYRFSVWRTTKALDSQSSPLNEPGITKLTDRMAKALDLPQVKVHVFDVDQVNGLAAPDGRIFLTRGFLTKYARALSRPRKWQASSPMNWAMSPLAIPNAG